MKERFVIEKSKTAFGSEIFILTDKETKVQYLYFRNGATGGLTPLVDPEGKPLLKD